jgi:hypothetical protein
VVAQEKISSTRHRLDVELIQQPAHPPSEKPHSSGGATNQRDNSLAVIVPHSGWRRAAASRSPAAAIGDFSYPVIFTD